MFRSTTFASLTILSALVAAPATVLAQAPMNGTVPLAQVGDVVGGGAATLSGGGDDMTITYLITLFPQPICQNEKRPLAHA